MKVNILAIFILLLFIPQTNLMSQTFRKDQQRYKRVRTAYAEKEEKLKKIYAQKGFESLQKDIFLLAYKKERVLEVWVRQSASAVFEKVIHYPFAGFSGKLGPKRKEGDGQIPEGFYHISLYNPYSSFYLSLKVDYPNASDRILSDKQRPGGDIFIHGNSCTIGCIPITDDKIKELYLLAVEARMGGQQKIPVWILPSKLDADSMKQLQQKFADKPDLIAFWTNLQQAYQHFDKNKKLPKISVDSKGKYLFR